MTWKSYAVLSGASIVATYLVSGPAAIVPQRTAPVAQRAATPPAAPAFDIQEQASRLQTRARQQTEYREPSRNPFRFGDRPASAPAPVSQPVVNEPPAEVPVAPPPSIKVSGIETNTVDGVRQRSALLITAAGVVKVREGDAVGAEYHVARIEDDAVDLVAADGSHRRISLRP
jgi:hypothetical protein